MKQPSFVAFPQDGFIALEVPNELIPTAAARMGSTGLLIRFKSEEGFKSFMLAAIETASLVWPEIAKEWKDVGEDH